MISLKLILILTIIPVFLLGTIIIIKLSQQVESQRIQIHQLQNQQIQCQQVQKQQVDFQEAQRQQTHIMQVEGQENQATYKRLQEALKDAWNDEGSIDDRALLSKRLNILSMKINQFMCDLDDDLTMTGGWCRKHFNIEHVTDHPLAAAMSKMLEGETVGSFGDGPGVYKELLTKAGLVKQYDAYDGSPYIEDSTDGKVKYLELTIPHFGLPVYDWTISLEVAEHIPAKYEDIFLSNLLRHAKKGVILSWALQTSGVGHVNVRAQEYVEEKMKKLCFDKDEEKTKELSDAAAFWWLKKNLIVYGRRNDSACKIDP